MRTPGRTWAASAATGRETAIRAHRPQACRSSRNRPQWEEIVLVPDHRTRSTATLG